MAEEAQVYGPGGFKPTRWSVVLAAADPAAGAVADQALAELCQTYWFPLYAYLRRRGYSCADAEDLVQAFFVRLLEKRAVAAADPARGRFRAFLLGSLKNFLINDWDRNSRQKRGGGIPVIELDGLEAEERCRLEPACEDSPERLFDRQWALTVIDNCLRRLRAEHEAAGRGQLFELLKGTIAAAPETAPYAEIAATLKISEDLVKVAVHRLRKRYRQLLHEEIAQTVGSTDDLEGEIRHLLECLRESNRS
jgi:RNA polymerase sigma-70 factor (ECF subfamily)